MGPRSLALTENQAAPIDCEEADFRDLRDRLTVGLNQARYGDLANGSGEEAVRRAFAGTRA